ncbi:MAG: hypothetical protein GX080_08650 [Tissierellia bacterium]|nr:hypothetical protein [Tissierellia bacterium]
MKLTKRKKFLLLILIGIMLVGCSIREDITDKDNSTEDEIVGEEDDNRTSLDVSSKDYNLLIRSEEISDAVVNLYGIDNATSIIFNDVVAIAVELAEDYTFSQELKETIVSTVKENDSSIKQVYVTDNKQVFNDIESVINALLNGQSYDSQVEKINSIIEKVSSL